MEAFAWHHQFLSNRQSRYDPQIAGRILMGKGVSAVEYIAMLDYRHRLVDRAAELFERCDALIMPTVPIPAPPIDGIQGDAMAWLQTNALLFRNTVIANLIDGCAVTTPCQRDGEAPVGLMLINGANADEETLLMGIATEKALKREGNHTRKIGAG